MASLLSNSTAQIELNYRCVTCALIFESPDNLKRHIQESHLSVVSESIQAKDIVSTSGNDSVPGPAQVQVQDDCEMPVISNVTTLHVDVKCLKCDGIFKSSEIEAHVHEAHTEQTETEEKKEAAKGYKCHICDKTLLNKKTLKNHIRNVHNGTEACSCQFCGQKFSYHFSLRQHIVKCSGNQKCNKDTVESIKIHDPQEVNKSRVTFSCDFCDKCFPTRFMLKDHRDSVHGTRKHECDICGRKYSQKGDMRTHKRKTHPDIYFASQKRNCVFCDKVLDNMTLLQAHIKELHMTGDRYQCASCPSTFSTKSNAKCHIQTTHKESKTIQEEMISSLEPDLESQENTDNNQVQSLITFNCDICDQDFASKFALKTHCELAHGDNQSPGRDTSHLPEASKCDVCDKSFSNRSSLKRHFDSAHEGKRYTCDICNASYTSISALARHRIKVHSIARPLTFLKKKCFFCDIVLDNLESLRSHVAEFHMAGERYQCPFCPSTLKAKSKAKRHIKTMHKKDFSNAVDADLNAEVPHGEENKPAESQVSQKRRFWTCDICDKQFTRKANLRTHCESVHSGRKYQCDICLAKYSREWYLTEHKTKVHSITSLPVCKKKCLFCDSVLDNMALMQCHVRECHMTGERYQCPTCPTTFKTKVALKRHMKALHKKPNQSLSLGESFILSRVPPESPQIAVKRPPEPTELHVTSASKRRKCASENEPEKSSNYGKQETMTGKMTSKAPVSCDICDKTLSTPIKLQKHIDVVHKRMQKFKCNKCKVRFGLIENLKRHQRKFPHGKCRILIKKCFLCDEAFNQRTLGKHMRERHMLDGKFTCTKCDMTYGNPKSLKHHFKARHPNPSKFGPVPESNLTINVSATEKDLESQFKAKVGNWLKAVIISAKDFNAAENHHHKDDIILGSDKKCHLCDFVAKNESRLKAHVTCMHTKDRANRKRHSYIPVEVDQRSVKDPQTCDVCDKTVQNKWSLRVHMAKKHSRKS